MGWTADDSHHVSIKETGAPPRIGTEVRLSSDKTSYAVGETARLTQGLYDEAGTLISGKVVDYTVTLNGTWYTGWGQYSDDPYKDLRLNKAGTYVIKGLFVGDTEYEPSSKSITITANAVGKKATNMVVTREPPIHAAVGELILFEGYLEDLYGNKLAHKKLVWHVESAGDVGEFDYTTPDGMWSFRVTPTAPGSISQYVYFGGDAEYTGSRTETYTTVTP